MNKKEWKQLKKSIQGIFDNYEKSQITFSEYTNHFEIRTILEKGDLK